MAVIGRAVSVVVPAYNAEATIMRCLSSIAAQTQPPTEIIVVDDASTDRTAQVAQASGLPNLHIERLHVNGGPGRARNIGVRRAQTDWVAFLDADDEWQPELLEAATMAASSTGAQVVGCGGVRVMLEPDGSLFERRFIVDGTHDARDISDDYWHMGIRALMPSGLLISREQIERVGGFPEDMARSEDTVLFARLWLDTRIIFVNRLLYRSQQHRGSLTVGPPTYSNTLQTLLRIGAVAVQGIARRRNGTRWLLVAYPRMVWQRHAMWLRGKSVRHVVT